MLTNLWLLSLFFLSNIIIALSFLTYSWIYIDAFSSQKKTKDALRGVGGILLAAFFIFNIINSNSTLGNITLISMLCLSTGLFAVFYGNMLEPIPGLPDEKIRKIRPISYILIIIFFIFGIGLAFLNTIPEYSRAVIGGSFLLFILILGYILILRKSFLDPNQSLKDEVSYKRQRNLSLFLIVIPFFTPPLLSTLISAQNYKKVNEGLSKEFKFLARFWTLFSIFTLIQVFSVIGKYYFVSIDVLTRQYSLIWILGQILLIICAFLMFKWVSLFISFRIVARLFLYIWQVSIFLTVILATAYSIFIITSSENQIRDLLKNNASLIQYNLNQIKSNNVDTLNLLGKDQELIQAIMDNDTLRIENEIGTFINSNSFLDKVQVVSNAGTLIYDSQSPTNEGINLNDNPIITRTLYTREGTTGFVAEKSGIEILTLNYQFTYPVVSSNGELNGIITSVKSLNNNYLDTLKTETGQELIIYINDKRSASTILESDNLSRLQNVPLVIDGLISEEGNVKFYKARILTTPYYLAVNNLKDPNENNLASIVIGTKQSILINLTENSLFNLFILALGITVFATIPSYFLAKNLRRNISA